MNLRLYFNVIGPESKGMAVILEAGAVMDHIYHEMSRIPHNAAADPSYWMISPEWMTEEDFLDLPEYDY